MILAACVDDGLGMRFAGRRQSKDASVRARLLALAGGRLLMSPYSARQFDPSPAIAACEDYLALAGPGDWVFAEDDGYLAYADQVETIILFRWNRNYPRDLCFAFPGEWRLVRSEDFPGTSHEKITQEVYEK